MVKITKHYLALSLQLLLFNFHQQRKSSLIWTNIQKTNEINSSTILQNFNIVTGQILVNSRRGNKLLKHSKEVQVTY